MPPCFRLPFFFFCISSQGTTGAAVLRSWLRPEPSQLIHSRSRGVDFFASPFFCSDLHKPSIYRFLLLCMSCREYRDNQALDSPHKNFCSKTRLGWESVGFRSLEAPTKI